MGNSAGQLDDKYFLQKVKLGQGSFGTVWRGVEKSSGTTVAVKQMDKAQLPRRGVKREDIEREVSVMKVVSHVNILRLFDFCEDHQHISFVLEYCDGGDFGDKVKERGSSVTEEEACKWVKQILSAIQALHVKDVCHRDIKPDNFMVSKSQIKLADFGLAIILPKNKLLTEKCGTPAFMGPEQMNVGKSRGYNHSVDVWAAGITMFMLMTGGKHPFVDTAGKLDEKRLMEGNLDFGSQGVFAMFGRSGSFSEAARKFCRRMVNPSPSSRITADAALKDPWMAVAGLDGDRGGDITRRPSATPRAPQAAAPQQAATGGGYDAPQPGTVGLGQFMNMGGLFGFFGDDQNKPPNAQAQPSEAMAKQRLQVVNGEIASMGKDPRGIHRENSKLKGRIEELERERRQLQNQLEQADKQRSSVPVVAQVAAASGDKTVREADRRATSRPTPSTMLPGGKVPVTNGLLPPAIRVRYNSSSAKCWLNATVHGFNENDGTYNLDVRQHADLTNISPDPTVKTAEAWPPGSLVVYHSSSANRWLDAVVISFVENSNGSGLYNLDLRECAEADRIRPRVTSTSC